MDAGGDPTYCHVLARRRVKIDVEPLFKEWIEPLEAYSKSNMGPPNATMGVLDFFKHLKETLPQDVALMQLQLEWFLGPQRDIWCKGLIDAGLTLEDAKVLLDHHPMLSHPMFNTPEFKEKKKLLGHVVMVRKCSIINDMHGTSKRDLV